MLLVTDIQRFCMHDGPGVRTTVFLKGCPLNCRWCHNPETKDKNINLMFVKNKCIGCMACNDVCETKSQIFDIDRSINRDTCNVCGKCAIVCPTAALNIVGEYISAEKILNEVEKDMPFYGRNGGLTLSGGEPTYQSESVVLLRMAKEKGISTCLETCGMTNKESLIEYIKYTDLFLFDIKDTNEERLYDNTGANLNIILDNLKLIDSYNKDIVLRCILISNVNMDEKHLIKLSEIYHSLKNVKYLELLPYHPYGISKDIQLGNDKYYEYEKPSAESVEKFAEGLRKINVIVKVKGIVD